MHPSHHGGWAASPNGRTQQVPLRRVLRLFRPYHAQLAVVGLLVCASSLVSVASPFMLRGIVDIAIPRRRTGLLTLLSAGMILTTVVSSIFGVLQTLLSTTVGQRIMHDLRIGVYSRLQHMELAFFTQTRGGEVQSRLANDIGGMQDTLTSTAASVVSNFTSVTATIVAMLALSWRLAIVSVLLLPIFMLISRNVGRERRTVATERQKQLASMTAMATESLSASGILLVRTMGRSDSLTRAFTEESERLASLEVRSTTEGRWRMSSISIVMAALPALLYWAAGLVAQSAQTALSLGTLVAFVSLQQGILGPAAALLATGVQTQTSLALFQRIFEYLDLPVGITQPAAPIHLDSIHGEVCFENVSFSYDSSGDVLSGINITVPAGSSLAIVGPTGSGKSTLGCLLPRLYDVTAGRITLDGADVRDLEFDVLASAIGVICQDTFLFHASVASNLRFAKPDATDEELQAAAQAAQIHDLITSLPNGYETLTGERGHRFSGGEKQRLAIARTLLRNPPVLILDEATSALDTLTEQAVLCAIETLSADRTTITITHRLPTIRDVDQIIVLDAGRIAERGTHEQLLAGQGRYAALLHDAAPNQTRAT
ncbi:ABC transporter ATP-binding protein [Streptomyces roseus]|uniref:ABC transporter ATP-binding protein n=1 Tax=Streptomyces roseus TaxID=66430 RepID=UPI0037FEEC5A